MMNQIKNISITDIKQSISTFSRELKHNIKDIFKLPYAIHYIVFSVFLTILFIIATFPYEVFIRKQIEQVEKQVTRSLFVDDINFNLLSTSSVKNISAILKDGSSLIIESLLFDMYYNPYTIFIKRNINGKLQFKKFEFKNSDISIISRGRFLFDVIRAKVSDVPEKGILSLSLRDTDIKGIMIKGFEIPPVSLKQIKYESEFISKNTLKIKYIIFTGPDLKGNASGVIVFGNTIRNSNIDLTINIDSQSNLLNQYRVLLGDMVKPGQNQLTFTINGPLFNPRINMKNLHNEIQ